MSFQLCSYHEDGLGWDTCSEEFEGCEVEQARNEKRMLMPKYQIVDKAGSVLTVIEANTRRMAERFLKAKYPQGKLQVVKVKGR